MRRFSRCSASRALIIVIVTATAIVASAGPISNFLLAIICQGLLVILAKTGVLSDAPFA